MKSVFLSYSSKDKDRISELVAALETHGWSVWWDHELEGGSKYEDVIKQRIGEATAVLVAWSRNSVDSSWVKDEAQIGASAEKLVPVLIDNVAPPMGMRDRHIVNLTEWDGSRGAAALQDVVKALNSVGGESEAAPAKAKTALIFGPRASIALYATALTAASMAQLRLAEYTIGCEALPPDAADYALVYNCGVTLENQLLVNIGVAIATLAFALRAAMATWNTAADLGFEQLYVSQARARHLGAHAVLFIVIFLSCFIAVSIDMIIYDEGYGATYHSVTAAYFDPNFMSRETAASVRQVASLREFAIDFGLLAVFGVVALYARLQIRQRSSWGEALLALASLMALGFSFFLLYYGRPALLTNGIVELRRAYLFGLGVIFASAGACALLSLLISRLSARRGS